jgi:uncharacterized membrane protein HdeD (DUF308 family)
MEDPRPYYLRNKPLFGLVDLAGVRENKGRFVALGVVLMILGVLAILMPFVAGVLATIVLGWLLLFGGVAAAIHAMADRHWGGSGWAIVSSIVYAIAGLLLIVFPLRGKVALTLVLSAFLVVDGILKIVRALQHRAVAAWGWLMFDGILALILGLMLWASWPSSAMWAIGLHVGIDLFFNGTSMLVLGASAGQPARVRA